MYNSEEVDMASNQLMSSILTEQKTSKAIFNGVSNTQLIQSPSPIIKGLDNSVSHLKLNGNVTDGGTGKCYYCFYFRTEDKVTQIFPYNQTQNK